MSFYDFVVGNKYAYESELDCNQIKHNILNHPKIKQTDLANVTIGYSTVKNNDDIIYFTSVSMFSKPKGDAHHVSVFEFYYIPFIDTRDDKKYYILIKDIKNFFNTDIKTVGLHVNNYTHLFTLAKTTYDHPNIEDIIMKMYIVHKKIQYEEPMLIVSNIMSHLQGFVLGSIRRGNRKHLETKDFDEYKHSMCDLMKEIVANNKLRYGVDYEFSICDVCEFIDLDIADIPKYSVPENFEYASVMFKDVGEVPSEYRVDHYCVAEPTQYNLRPSWFLPGKEWSKFYEGIKIYQKYENAKEMKLYESNGVDSYPEGTLNYLDSIPTDKYEKVQTNMSYEKLNDFDKYKFDLISSTNKLSPVKTE